MNKPLILKAHRIGIDTYKQAVIFVRNDCEICRAEGFELHSQVNITLNNDSLRATLNIVIPSLLPEKSVGLSEFAWQKLKAKEGDNIQLSRLIPPISLSGYFYQE